MGLFCFWLKCLTLSSRWRRKAEEEKRKKEAEEQHKAAQMPSYEEQMDGYTPADFFASVITWWR